MALKAQTKNNFDYLNELCDKNGIEIIIPEIKEKKEEKKEKKDDKK